MLAGLLKIFGLPGSIALGAALLLAITCGVLGVQLYVAKADVKSAQADKKTAETERDAATQRAAGNLSAANGFKTIGIERLALLETCQRENTRVAAANQVAVADARAKALDAERTLQLFIDKYAARNRSPNCAAARADLDRFCPALDY